MDRGVPGHNFQGCVLLVIVGSAWSLLSREVLRCWGPTLEFVWVLSSRVVQYVSS